jgi:two-component system alkaline phosphatase synthesis response regulator PhoP
MGTMTPSRKRALVVEDERALGLALEDRLMAEGWEVEWVRDGARGLQRALDGSFDVLVLDLMLPGMDGFEVVRELSTRGSTLPVLILSARGEVHDRVVGLKLGADDYLVKPFEMAELLARLDALTRRRGPPEPRGTVTFGDVEVDLTTSRVTRDGVLVDLSAKEYQLLAYFIRHRDQVLSRERLLKDVWGYRGLPVTRTVDVHVGSLRRKLEMNRRRPRHFLTVRGRGYRFRLGP